MPRENCLPNKQVNMIKKFESLLAKGTDNALLRYSLGNAYLKEGRPEVAVGHLAKALELDPSYSAAWKIYAKALVGSERFEEAITAYKTGIEAAERKGDVQAAKEMRVFLKRLTKQR